MNDFDRVRLIASKLGRPVPHRMEDGACIDLSLTDASSLFHGLLRHQTPAMKMEILGDLCGLVNLRRLDLRRNLLGSLPNEFKSLVNLEHLVLGSNYLGCIPDQLRPLSKLKYLHFSNNELTELPNWFHELKDLEHLLLHKNLRLKCIDPLANLSQLKSLNLYFISFPILPELVYGFKSLVTLTLWNVNDFPYGLDAFKELQFFSNCGGPGTRSLPKGLTKVSRLRMTRLFQNSLSSLPEDIGDLVNLEQISLYQNQLSRLPESMARLKKLTKVNIGWNQFVELPQWLAELPNLEWLGAFGNLIQNESVPIFRSSVRVDLKWPFSTNQIH